MRVLIKEYRGFRKMSQQELANRLGRNVWTISRWETGHLRVPLLEAKRIAAILHVSLDQLVVEDNFVPDAPTVLEKEAVSQL